MARTLIVVGAGPAGMAAAIEAVARGCRVTVIDEAALPGGQIYRQSHPALGKRELADAGELARKHRLLEGFARAAGRIDYRPGAAVFALFPSGEVHVAEGGSTEVLRADAIVLATGVRELAIPFPGWTTPGVMFAGGAQAILKSQQVLPGREAVVAGCGPLPMVVAAQLLRAGGRVKALATLHPFSRMLRHAGGLWHGRGIVAEGLRYGWTVVRSGVERLTGYVPTRVIGRDHVEAVVLARMDGHGRVVAGSEREIACDLLALNYGFVANSELAAMAGVAMRRDAVAGGWLPRSDEFGRTSIPGLFVAGDGAGLRGALIAELDGRIVGAAAAAEPRQAEAEWRAALGETLRQRRRQLAFQAAVRETLQLPKGAWSLVSDDTTVCRCENVTLGDIRGAFGSGHVTLNAVKRNVRAGMGWCGGRTCLHAVAALAELHSGVAPAAMMTPRPLARPVSFAALANQRKAGVP
ncbi:MAG: FAD-dependent oxidoreductase [Alphaproteobacteria bacterium]